jgi:hypothetical protein
VTCNIPEFGPCGTRIGFQGHAAARSKGRFAAAVALATGVDSDDRLRASHGQEHEIGFAAGAVRASSVRSPGKSSCLTPTTGGRPVLVFPFWKGLVFSLYVAHWDTFLESSSEPELTQGTFLFEVVESAQQPGDSSPSRKWRTACFFLLQEDE